jgi:hypothetical protein
VRQRETMPFSFRNIRRSQSIELLASLVLLMCLAAFGDLHRTYAVIVSLLFAFVLVTAVRAATGDNRHRMIAYGLAVLWLVTNSISTATQNEFLQVVTDIPFIAFCFFCVGMILRRIVTSPIVDFEVVCASVAAYLLIAITWAVSYKLIYNLWPQSFSVAQNGAEWTLHHFIYFSMTTITTLGYGDITPASVPVGIWSTLEAATGVFYMAILVARLVSIYRP